MSTKHGPGFHAGLQAGRAAASEDLRRADDCAHQIVNVILKHLGDGSYIKRDPGEREPARKILETEIARVIRGFYFVTKQAVDYKSRAAGERDE